MRIMVLAVALMTALAGCSSKPDAADGPDEDIVVDEIVQAVIGVAINGSVVSPLPDVLDVEPLVNITFDGSASTSTGGIVLWDFGDGGKATTINATHAYGDGGLFNVTLTVGPPSNASVAWLAINVSSPAPSVPQLVATVPFSFTGNLPLGNPNSPMNDGIDYRDHPVPVLADLDGVAVLAREARVAIDGEGATAIDSYVYWRGPDGTNLGSAGSIGGADLDHSFTYSDPMPAGDYVVRARLPVGANMDYTVTVELDYYDS